MSLRPLSKTGQLVTSPLFLPSAHSDWWEIFCMVVTVLPLTGVNLFSLCALFAFNIAAPAHLALARSRHHPALSVVAPAAADGLTILILVAFAGHGACRILARPAIAWRVLDVKKVRGAGNEFRSRARRGLLPLGSGLGDFPLPSRLIWGAGQFDWSLVTLLELLADFVEGCQLPPACLDGTRSRNAVTLTGGLHPRLDHLCGTNVKSSQTRHIKGITFEILTKHQHLRLQLSQQTQHSPQLRYIKDAVNAVFTKPLCCPLYWKICIGQLNRWAMLFTKQAFHKYIEAVTLMFPHIWIAFTPPNRRLKI